LLTFKFRLSFSLEQVQLSQTSVVIPIHNRDNFEQPPYAYSYPPTYISPNHYDMDKPPSYEQTIEQILPAESQANTSSSAVNATTNQPAHAWSPSGN
jgi:hypothetical protein